MSETKTNDGGPAFPIQAAVDAGGRVAEPMQPGMSLRDWYKGEALVGLLSNSEYGAELRRKFDPDSSVANAGSDKESPQEYVARLCGAFADAMLAERSK